MDIMELDEFEGLTADMVRAWLRVKGWELAGTGEHQYWRCGSGGVAEALLLTDLPLCIGYIANGHGLSPQSLLREINPRMRRGRPSQAERDAHEGPWLASLPGSHVLLVGTFSDDGETFFPGLAAPMRNTCEGAQDWMDAWSFWPCDQHGNKVRWPERDGVML